jgi:hypothetical protein
VLGALRAQGRRWLAEAADIAAEPFQTVVEGLPNRVPTESFQVVGEASRAGWLRADLC